MDIYSPREFLLNASMCLPPHRITHPEKLDELIESFKKLGWDNAKPKLIGYSFYGMVQLITGSHRWWAAKLVGIKIPVKVYSYSHIKSIWGTDEWITLLKENT
jgi:ParB-like chromosome segregation protein Spo0J